MRREVGPTLLAPPDKEKKPHRGKSFHALGTTRPRASFLSFFPTLLLRVNRKLVG